MSNPVVVIGTGRMGTALGRWLPGARPVPGRRADDFQPAWTGHEPGLMLLAIADDALAAMARRLAAWGDWQGWRVLHTSGARPAAVLDPLRRAGAAVASMHPMMTFPSSSRRHEPVSPTGIVFSLEGDAPAVHAAAKLVRSWRGVALRLSASEKAAYHLAATLVGPGAVVQMAAAERVLRHAELSPSQLQRARAGLARLLAATAQNLATGPTAQAFTGPWARGDRGTIRVHRRLAADNGALRLYAALEAMGQSALPNPRF